MIIPLKQITSCGGGRGSRLGAVAVGRGWGRWQWAFLKSEIHFYYIIDREAFEAPLTKKKLITSKPFKL